MRQRLLRQWFFLALVLVVAAGFCFADQLSGFAESFPREALVAIVLFAMAWSLDASAVWRAIRNPVAVALAILINIGLVPLLAWGASFALTPEFAMGLALAAAMPCTIASAAVWTRRAGGNDAVAMLVTVVTNFSCFIVTPLWLMVLTSTKVDTSTTAGKMVTRLLLIAVLPMVLGQLLRLKKPLARWATEHKSALGTVAQFGILTMVLIGIVHSARTISSPQGVTATGLVQPADWIVMVATVLGLHVVSLFAGFGLGRLAGLPRAEWIPVGMAGSQKTLMIGLDLGILYFPGLAILPIVVYHVGQLLFDIVVADRLSRGAKK